MAELDETRHRGVPVVVSAPSGAGKTTLCHAAMQRLPGIEFSVSHTTRAPRPKEQEGLDYFFVDDRAFDALVRQGAFLEWAHVHDRRYGTSRAQADSRLSRGLDVLFDIDVQGGRQIKNQIADAVLVFILPPDLATLEARLRGRGSDSAEQIARRLTAAQTEIEAAAFYTYWIVNDELERATGELVSILRTERLARRDHQALARTFLAGRRLGGP